MAPTFRLLILVLSSLPVFTLAELWAQYVRSPDSISTPLGDDVTFTCTTNNRVEKIIWWHKQWPSRDKPKPSWTEINFPKDPTNTDAPYHITAKSASSRLTVSFRDESLAGEYRCVSWNGASALASVSAKLNSTWIAPAPHYENKRYHVANGATVFIRCPPLESVPPPTMIYYRMDQGNPVDLGSDKDSGGLLVRPENDSTTVYTCAARNSHADKVYTYNHRITVITQKGLPKAPSFEPDMQTEVIGYEGKSIALACSVNGYPAPKITWVRQDNLPLSRHVEHAPNSPLLHFKSLHLSDRGEYVCKASNSVGITEKVVRLRIWHRARFVPEKGSLKDESVLEGSSIQLSCGHEIGEPKPTFYWLINGFEVTRDPSIKTSGKELLINPVEKRHAGVVQCFTTNMLGSDYIGSILRVIPKQFTLQGNEDLDLVEPVRPNNRRRNKLGGKRPGQTKPKIMIPPSKPDITRLADDSVMVRWNVQHNDGLRIEFFKVQYRDLNATTERGSRDSRWNTLDQNIPRNVHSYEVGGLTAGHYYRFRIAAVYSNDDNLQGQNSAKFLLLRGVDLPTPPPPTPMINRTEAVSTTSIRLFWNLETSMEVTKNMPLIEGFYVYYRPTSTAGDYIKEAVEGGNVRQHTLNYLQPGVQYEIKLKSFSHSVASGFSSIITQGTLKPPVVEKPNEINTIMNIGIGSKSNTGSESDSNQMYIIVGSAVGGIVLVVGAIFAFILCKRRKDDLTDKQGSNGNSIGRNSNVIEGLNGYIPSASSNGPNKPTITITPNPLHPESENIDMEMSYIASQNNNCTPSSPRSSAELSVSMPSSCREEMRKQNPITLSIRENYV